ncbi:MAG: acetyl-CoA carboxylase biotin carboxyl carrier protein subunit [Clostridiales bacterium]|jgi:glutaconyl-CoA decarboxylase|nr:acetyl-CoA carboxylase biotin carboxyl carrier protein subunit [Clostridiales bacterium]
MRKFRVNVNGNSYEVEVEEIAGTGVAAPTARAAIPAPVVSAPAPTPAPTARPASANADRVFTDGYVVKAPMPGTLMKFKVEEGDSVKRGQPVAILEAMKMENDINAPVDGRVHHVAVKGASLNAGDVIAVIK